MCISRPAHDISLEEFDDEDLSEITDDCGIGLNYDSDPYEKVRPVNDTVYVAVLQCWSVVDRCACAHLHDHLAILCKITERFESLYAGY